MKKKNFFCMLALIIICMSCLFACTPLKLEGGPNLYDPIYGNGGTSVVKGDYLYFTNAYKNYEDLGNNDNEYDGNNTRVYGIYRVKLNNGAVDVLEDGSNTPKGAELLVPLITGYVKTGLYICGDYLFYTAPCSYYINNQSTVTTGYIRFERVKLDGTDRIILSEKAFTKDSDYNINYINGTTYITIYGNQNPTSSSSTDTRDIYTIWSKDGNHGQSNLVTTSASSCATYSQENIIYTKKDDNYVQKTISEVNKYIYYTKKDADSKHSLYRKSISNDGEEEILIMNSDKELKLVAVKNDRVYFKEDNLLYSASKKEEFDDANKRTLYTTSKITDGASSGITDYVILDDTLGTPIDRGIIAVRNDNSVYSVIHYTNKNNYRNETSFAIKHDKSKQINIVFAREDQIFYTIQDEEEKILYSYKYDTQTSSTSNHAVVIYKFSTSIDDKTSMFDYDANRVYFFGKVENSNQNLNYLQMAMLEENPYKNAENKSIAIYMGILHSSDIKAEE